MTSPLRNAARALCKAQSGVECFDDLEPEAQERAVEHARAVLQATREPSEAMTEALRHSILREYGINQQSQGRLIRMWQAMLDSLLAEQP